VDKAYNFINKMLDFFAVILVCFVFLLIIIQVVMRYVFNSPLIWSEELARYAMVWMAFVGSVIAMRNGEHIDITVVVNSLPASLKTYVNIISKIISTAFLIMLIYLGFQMVMMNISQTSSANGLPMSLIYLCIPLSAIGMLFFNLVRKGGK